MERPLKHEPVWDKANSTFMRNIHLVNGRILTGYSKKYLNSERRDKIDLLTNWILRDLKNGYLDKRSSRPNVTPLDHIEYFFRVQTSFTPIIHLHYEYADWKNLSWMDNKKFFAFISRLYDKLQKQTPVEAIVNELEVRTRAPRLDPFSLSQPRFASVNHLNAFVAQKRLEGKYEDDEIENFYRKYLDKFFKL